MKWAITIITYAAVLSCLDAQQEDNIWIFGVDSNNAPAYPGVDRIIFEFRDSLKIRYEHDYFMPVRESNAMICDSSGRLLLLSNGCYIESGDGQYLENSDSLNPGFLYNQRCAEDGLGYNVNQSMMLLPAGSDSVYYLFHTPLFVNLTPVSAYINLLYYTKIVKEGDQWLVSKKNQIVLTDTLDLTGLCAVRHANGRDWWLVVAKDKINTYYKVLVTPYGIQYYQQTIDTVAYQQCWGEMVFSPDGDKMARFDPRNDLRIFDFDRCTGELSNPVHISITNAADIELYGGLAFSADGRYLYAAEVTGLLQFDMAAADIGASMQLIGTIEFTGPCNFGRSVAYMELGPDGRIYARPLNGQNCMHRINRPEKENTTCEFQQYYYQLDFAYKGLPHFPNFRLGPIDGSACDTLGIDNVPLAGWRHDPAGGLSVEFTSVSWHEPEQWQWDFGDGAFSAERNPAHTFPAPGAYEVCLTVSNTYGSDTKCKTVWVGTSSVGEAPGRDRPQVYPNPTAGLVTIEGLASGSRIRVFDGLGRLVGEYIHQNTALDLGALPPGVYYLQCTTPDGAEVAGGKVVVGR
jgi:hypothetical protein